MTAPVERVGRIDAANGDLAYFARNPRGKYVVIARAEGAYLFDDDGRPILDGASGAAVVCLGHGNRRIIERLRMQAETVAFAHTSAFVTQPLLDLATRLAAYTSDPHARVYFVSGGSEATETALKIARAYQLAVGRSEAHVMISRSISYHGATMGSLAMTGVLQRRRDYEPLMSQFPRISTCYCYRCPVNRNPELCDVECADDLEQAIVAIGEQRVAGFILEPVIGSSAPGVSARGDYMQTIANTCRRHGVLLIADEVMSGVGRTGRFFAMEHYAVTPDITVLSKGISSGYYPLAAVIVSGRVFDAIKTAPRGFVHGFTYAGNPLGATVGLEVLNILEEEQLVPRAAALGERLLQRLETLRQFPMVGDIRGRGLLVGIELVADRVTRRPFAAATGAGHLVLNACLDEGLAVYPTTGSVDGIAGDNILLAPPYIITEPQLDELVEKLTRGMARVQQHLLESTTPPIVAMPAVYGHE